MFPKKGKFFPDRTARPGSEISYKAVIKAALREEMRERCYTAKVVMEWTGSSERTVKNWLAGRSGPRGTELICIMRHSKKVFGAILSLAGRGEFATSAEIAALRDQIAETLARLNTFLNER